MRGNKKRIKREINNIIKPCRCTVPLKKVELWKCSSLIDRILVVSELCTVLFPAVFCIYYISRGVLQENRQELVAFVLSVLVVMIRSVVNFSVVDSEGKQELLLKVIQSFEDLVVLVYLIILLYLSFFF